MLSNCIEYSDFQSAHLNNPQYQYRFDNLRYYSAQIVSSSALLFAISKCCYFDDFERNINTGNGAVADLDYIFAYGRLVALVRTSGGSKTSYGYTGHEHIDEFGLINMNARIYDSKLGMFISVDPQAGSYPGTYPYTYCGGDPVNRVDLTGEDWYEDQNGNLYWQEGHKDLDGYSRLGASVSFQLGEDSYFNSYQNAGIIGNQGF